MKKVIAVIGSDQADTGLSAHALAVAQEVGKRIAQNGAVLSCGGRGGIMQAACKGAHEQQGLTLGILPTSKHEANSDVDIGLPTMMGPQRNCLVVATSDVVIAIGGRWGTLNELSYAAILQKPLVLIQGTGGVVDSICQSKLVQNNPRCVVVNTAEDAINAALTFIKPV